MSQRKNVLLIVVDQWRGDALPCLGDPHLKIPNIDRLCRRGVTFRNHYSQSAPCGPARASLLTGLYQMTHRLVQNGIPLDARFTNLAYELAALGYDPALIGYTTTLPDPRTTRANDPRFSALGDIMDGFRPVGSMVPHKDQYFGWAARGGFALSEPREDMWRPRDGTCGPTTAPSRIPAALSDTAWATDCALTYLEGARHSPWFLHLGYYRPHPPFIAPEPYNAMYDPAAMPAPHRAASPAAEAEQHPLLRFYLGHNQKRNYFQGADGLVSEMSADEFKRTRAAYYGLMSEVDDNIGRVLASLDASGQAQDTLVVLTCDHGEQMGDHHLLGKLGYFDETFHIPMIVCDPDPAADATRGTIVDHFTETVDTMPTILDWLGGTIPRQCDGRSLLPFLRGAAPADWRREVHFEYDFRDDFNVTGREAALGLAMDQCSLAAIRDTRYKYVHFAALPPLFFDLADDPHQFRNRAADPACAALVRDYAQKMLSWRLAHADKTLTGYRSTPRGLERRA